MKVFSPLRALIINLAVDRHDTIDPIYWVAPPYWVAQHGCGEIQYLVS